MQNLPQHQGFVPNVSEWNEAGLGMRVALLPYAETAVQTSTKESGKLVQMPAQERRKSVRYLFTATAEVVDLETNTRLSARTSDLARGGCFIDTTFPIGTNVSLRLTNGNKKFEGRARVVYEAAGSGMGLAFTAVEPDQLWVLEKWLGALSGELVPELHEHEEDTSEMVVHDTVASRGPSANSEHGFVLNELIIALMRKRVLSESEGKQLLQKLMR